MRWLSESVEALIDQQQPRFDAVIVGSGYGGAVAALRLAEADQVVCVLERGEEWLAGDFPTDLSQVGKHVRAEASNARSVNAMGYEGAMFDFRIGERVGALVGNGLGGGSLINAGVGLRAENRVFEQATWPKALRSEDLQPWYEKAETALGLAKPDALAPAMRAALDRTAKNRRLQDLHDAAQRHAGAGEDIRVTVSWEQVPVAVHFGAAGFRTDDACTNSEDVPDAPPSPPVGLHSACNGCGNCVTGCNHDAKLSLAKTYLPAAKSRGAKFYTGATVLKVSHDPQEDEAYPWIVTFVRTSERKLQHDIRKTQGSADRHWLHEVRARRIVLAAGTFGSTEILMRSRGDGDVPGTKCAPTEMQRPPLSLANLPLGHGVSGNGDDIAFVAGLPEDANAVGRTSTIKDKRTIGPTISAAVRFSDPLDLRRSTMIQDGAIPGLLAPVFAELVQTLSALSELDRFSTPTRDGRDAFAVRPEVRSRTLTLLGMGHDSCGGQIRLDPASDRIRWAWENAASESTPALHRARMQGAAERLSRHSLYLQNPATGVLPAQLGNLMSGPALGGSLFTVHPLGGCRMADSVEEGVCDHLGRVFRREGGVHDGLYVMDGSTIPSSLGVNPMLTITALAERSCAAMLAEIGSQRAARGTDRAPPAPCLPLPPRPTAQPLLDTGDAVLPAVDLCEVLRGKVQLHATMKDIDPGSEITDAALFVQMRIDDWERFFDDPDHRAKVVLPVPGKQQYPDSRLLLQRKGRPDLRLDAIDGSVHLFRRREDRFGTRLHSTFRLLLTHVISRWLPDWIKSKRMTEGRSTSRMDWRLIVGGGAKSLWHASEVRLFEYRLQLRHPGDNTGGYTLTGTKLIDGAASWGALRQWARSASQGRWPAVQRRSIWQQLGELDIALHDPQGRLLLSGRLAMDLPDIARNLLPSLRPGRDTLHALYGLMSYPLWLGRGLLKTRLLDFRAPDYAASLPETDPAPLPLVFPPLPCKDGGAPGPVAEVTDFWVPGRHDDPESTPMRLALVRYRQTSLQVKADPDSGVGVRKVKAILLINGFAQSTRTFVASELGADCLAARLHSEGWDVWMLEYRVSPLLAASARFSTLDDIAACDIPPAIDKVCAALARELGIDRPELLRIHAFSHCVGSAALAMSLAQGRLSITHPDAPPGTEPPPLVHKLAGVSFSQFQPYLVGSDSAQQRLQLGSFIHNVLGRDVLDFAAGSVKPDLLHALLDRVFATLPHDGQHCPHEDDLRQHQPDTTTCKRMSGLLSRLFDHERLGKIHHNLDHYFGRTNLGVFLHGAKCVHYERLVDYDGRTYLYDDKVSKYLDLPIMLMHGTANQLFDIESLARSRDQLNRIFGEADADMRLDTKDRSHQRINAYAFEGYAHFDCTVGETAVKEIYPSVLTFFENAWTRGTPESSARPIPRSRARLPITGPLMGWVRPGNRDDMLVRVWAEFDGIFSDCLHEAVTLTSYRTRKGQPLQPTQALAWKVSHHPLSQGSPAGPAGQALSSGAQFDVATVVADVPIPLGATEVSIIVLGIYKYLSPPSRTAPEPPPPEHGKTGAHVAKKESSSSMQQQPGTPPAAAISIPSASTYPSSWGEPMIPDDLDRLNPIGGSLRPFSHRLPGSVLESLQRILDIEGPGVISNRSWLTLEKFLPDEGEPRQDAPAISPLELTIDANSIKRLIDPLCKDLDDRREVGDQAAPGTLSGILRQRRDLSEAELKVPDHLLAPKAEHPTPASFLAAGCRHPGLTGFEAQRADHTLLALAASPATAAARFMAMLGDQVYVDARAGLFDSASEIERIVPRYRQAFGSPGFRAVASRLPLTMVIDDHEINDNWTSAQRLASLGGRRRARIALDAFHAYQRSHGPDPLPGGSSRRIRNNYALESEQLSLFVLDSRTTRILAPERRILSKAAWRLLESWLLEQKQNHGSRPKWLLSGSVLAPGLCDAIGHPSPRDCDTWQFCEPDRRRLLSYICRHRIENVVFLSCDYHCAATADIELIPGELRAFAIVAPPLHAPLRFANSESSNLIEQEMIPCDPGPVKVTLRKRWDGDGWLQCTQTLQQAADGTTQWHLEAIFHLRRLEEGAKYISYSDALVL